MCHVPWSDEPTSIIHLDTTAELDTKAFQKYIDWLYTNQWTSHAFPSSDNFIVRLLEALNIALAVQDEKFQERIVAIYTSAAENKVNRGYGVDSARYAFEVSKNAKLKLFFLQQFLGRVEPTWFVHEAAKFSQSFLRGIGDTISTHFDQNAHHDKQLQKWTNGTYVYEDEPQAAGADPSQGAAGA